MSLNVKMPVVFNSLIEGVMGAFRFDIGNIVSIGCVATGSAYIKGLLGQVAMLGAVFLVVGIVYVIRQKRAHSKATSGDSASAREHVKELFDRFDADGDGVELEEVAEIVSDIDPSATADQVAALFTAADSDNSGVIDFDEFFSAVQSTDSATSKSGSGLNFQKLVLKKQEADIRDGATGQAFLIVFLLYPSFTNKIFEGFSCIPVGDDESVLYVDHSVSTRAKGPAFLLHFFHTGVSCLKQCLSLWSTLPADRLQLDNLLRALRRAARSNALMADRSARVHIL